MRGKVIASITTSSFNLRGEESGSVRQALLGPAPGPRPLPGRARGPRHLGPPGGLDAARSRAGPAAARRPGAGLPLAAGSAPSRPHAHRPPLRRGMETTEVNGKPRVQLVAEGVLDSGGTPFTTFRVRYQVAPPTPEEPLSPAPGRAAAPRPELRPPAADQRRDQRRRGEPHPRLPRARDRPVSLLPAEAAARRRGRRSVAAGRITGPDTLLLMPPPGEVMIGVWRAETLVTGDRIAKVVFLLDGQPQLARTKPPYLGRAAAGGVPPRAGGAGRRLRRSAAGWWPGTSSCSTRPAARFRVIITEPKRGRRGRGRAWPGPRSWCPRSAGWKSVELSVNDSPVATLTPPPWSRRDPGPPRRPRLGSR